VAFVNQSLMFACFHRPTRKSRQPLLAAYWRRYTEKGSGVINWVGIGVRKRTSSMVVPTTAVHALLLLNVMTSSIALSQGTNASSPRFDEVSIKLSEPTADPAVHSRFANSRDGSFSAMTATVSDLVCFANEIDCTLVVGGPDWVRSVRYEVRAKAKPSINSDSTQDRVPFKLMARSLLAEKFNLRTHTEKRLSPVLAMSVSNAEIAASSIVPSSEPLTDASGATKPESVVPSGDGLAFKNSSMQTLTNMLSRRLGRPVLDESGIKGKVDFRLVGRDLIMIEYGKNSPDRDQKMRETVEKQLGLKLESRTAPMDVIVIDEVAQP
jgi:uncharacterized protein (TIGR03435 family)